MKVSVIIMALCSVATVLLGATQDVSVSSTEARPQGELEFIEGIARLPFAIVLENQLYAALQYKTFREYSERKEYTDRNSAIIDAIKRDTELTKEVERIFGQDGYDIAAKYLFSMALVRGLLPNAQFESSSWIEWFKKHRRETIEEFQKISDMTSEDRRLKETQTENTIIEEVNVHIPENSRQLEFRIYTEPKQKLTGNLSGIVRVVNSKNQNFGRLAFRDVSPEIPYDAGQLAEVIVTNSPVPQRLINEKVYPEFQSMPNTGVIFYGGKDYTHAVKKMLEECVTVHFVSGRDNLFSAFHVQRRSSSGDFLPNEEVIKRIRKYIDTRKSPEDRPIRGLMMTTDGRIVTDHSTKEKLGWKVSTIPLENEQRWTTPNTKEVRVELGEMTTPLILEGEIRFTVMQIGISELNQGRQWDPGDGKWSKPDPYFVVKHGRYPEHKSEFIADTLNPRWEKEGFELHIPHPTKDPAGNLRSFTLRFWDDDYWGSKDDRIGKVTVDIDKLKSGMNDYLVDNVENINLLRIHVEPVNP